jgi:pyruvate/2-oxoglutarate dehydrogenase complex dihydrolipoamide acyltransferase (E2) component
VSVVEQAVQLEYTPTPQSAHSRPVTGIRRLIAERMALSHREIPGVHVVEEMDLTDGPLGAIVAVGAAAIGRVVSQCPLFNAHLEGDEITCFDRCDVGVAVDTERGLMVPVLRDCGNRSVEDLQAEIASLAEKARAGRLTRGDVSGATITLTSPGKRGGVLATPLINPPQTAIVGIHRAVPRLVLHEGSPTSRLIANLTVTFDHRIIDGALAGDFTLDLARQVERGIPEGAPRHRAEPAP